MTEILAFALGFITGVAATVVSFRPIIKTQRAELDYLKGEIADLGDRVDRLVRSYSDLEESRK